jgi:hypothetical protein
MGECVLIFMIPHDIFFQNQKRYLTDATALHF